MELTPNIEVKQKVPEIKPENTIIKEESLNKDTGFISDAHEFAVTEYNEALKTGDADSQKLAEKVAESMGSSEKYPENPFDEKNEKSLREAYERGEKARELQREESRIMLDESIDMGDD